MYITIMRKELKQFLKNPGNMLFVFVLPVLFILLMTTALRNYVGKDYNTFRDGKLLVFNGGATETAVTDLENFRRTLKNSTGVIFENTGNPDEAKERVNRSEAFGLITLKGNKVSYYRSPYNEPVGGKLVRGIFQLVMGKNTTQSRSKIKTTVINKPAINSNAYFTFTELAFIMMFIALVIGQSVINERRLGTIERIKLAKRGISTLLISKLTLGIIAGFLQVVTVYLFSSLYLGVKWGDKIGYILLVLLSIAVLSSTFGIVIGMIARTKTVLDSIILMSVMSSSYAGGVLAPVYLMEHMSIVKVLIKLSPLYWTGKSLNSLHAGIVDMHTWVCLAVCMSLTVVLLFIYKALSKKSSLMVQTS